MLARRAMIVGVYDEAGSDSFQNPLSVRCGLRTEADSKPMCRRPHSFEETIEAGRRLLLYVKT
jgi:hypothetical protein